MNQASHWLLYAAKLLCGRLVVTPLMEDTMAKMDRKLVAANQQYEVAYFARKHRISAAEARGILQRAGRSREQANALAETEKRR